MSDTADIESLRVRLENELMQLPGVVGVGTGLKQNTPCLVVYTSEPIETVQPRLPRVLLASSVQVELRYVGIIKAQTLSE